MPFGPRPFFCAPSVLPHLVQTGGVSERGVIHGGGKNFAAFDQNRGIVYLGNGIIILLFSCVFFYCDMDLCGVMQIN